RYPVGSTALHLPDLVLPLRPLGERGGRVGAVREELRAEHRPRHRRPHHGRLAREVKGGRAMPLDPQAQKVLDATAALGLPPTEQMTPAEARESMRSRPAALGPGGDLAPVGAPGGPVEGGTITVRCYPPAGRGPFPAYIYFHGGGWVIGDIETHDGICRSLANASGSVVASVDYRLAPEHKFPVAAEDAYAATQWVAREAARLGVDGRRLAGGGDSAGGNLAPPVCLMSRDRSAPTLALQVLAYPVTQYNLDTRSYHDYADGYLLTRNSMR